MNYAVWNVRGLNKSPHQNEVKNFISENNISFMAFLETKVSIDNSIAISKKINRNWLWLFNYDFHDYGRIWLGWDANVWTVNMHSMSDQQITVSVTFMEKQLHFSLTFVYALNKPYQRSRLWSNLQDISKSIFGPWCVQGDFNCILSLDEVSGGREQWTQDMQRFKECIHDCGLGHVHTIGPLFTWSNGRLDNLISKRLDRILANADWFTTFSESYAMVKHKGIMDHNPMILYVPMTLDAYHKAFQFFTYMIDIPEFLDVVKKAWEPIWYGHPMSILCKRLQQVKRDLVVLNRKKGNVHDNVLTARENLKSIQSNLIQDPLSPSLLQQEKMSVLALQNAILYEDSLLLQKSRVNWLTVGDGNTKYFFNQTKANWNSNKIMGLEDVDGIFTFGKSNVDRIALNFFKDSLGSEPSTCTATFENLQLKLLSAGQCSVLTAPVTSDLIYKTLQHMKKNKAPGPDGFTVEFFLASWDIVGNLFCEAVMDFFTTSVLHKGANNTAITLVPKIKNPTKMTDFRPISLCSVVYKCITKILASRMSAVLPSIVDLSQSAFLKGRNIADNIILAQELFRGYTRQTGASKCALKLDLHKAFDSLNWDFLMMAMEKLGFPNHFIRMIYSCISTVHYSIKVNGALVGYFKGKKGIRQGDPISSYLFTIAMTVLSSILNKVPDHFKFHWRCKEINLTHLFYADDVLLFSHGDKNSIQHLMTSMNVFAEWSGLHINLQKSAVFFSNCNSEVMNWFNHTFQISNGLLPVRFLGVPLTSAKLSVNDCMLLIEKITARIISWTTFFLSLAGRIILIKAVVFSIQAFWSNVFLLPGVVYKHIQSICTRFIWKGNISQKGGAKVSWKVLCLPRDEGGLGLKNFSEWNKAQLLNHVCRIISKSKSLWPQWVHSCLLKKDDFWVMKEPTDCSWLWRRLLRLRPLARSFISFKIGNGRNTSVWFDPWWNRLCLASGRTDPIICQSHLQKSSMVYELIQTGDWVLPNMPSSVRHSHPGLINWIRNFDRPNFNLLVEDELLWDGIQFKKLKIWNIWDNIRWRLPKVPWYNLVWHRLQIYRYAHIEWLVCLNRLPTFDRLKSFGMDVTNQCLLCIQGDETRDHLFINCTYSKFILGKLASEMGIDSNYTTWLDCLQEWGSNTDTLTRVIALVTIQIFVYHIWRERNARLHNKGIFGPLKLLSGIIRDIKTKLSSSLWFRKHVCNHNLRCFWL